MTMWVCDVCHGVGGMNYMVRDDLWKAVVPEDIRMLCLSCFQGVLGRPLEIGDFKAGLPINDEVMIGFRIGQRFNRRHLKNPASAPPERMRMKNKWVLFNQKSGHYFRGYTGIGPQMTFEIEEAFEFDSKQEAERLACSSWVFAGYDSVEKNKIAHPGDVEVLR